MSTNKAIKGRLALVIPLFTAITLLISACSSNSYGGDPIPKTSKYVFDKFKGGEFLDAFTPDQPEVGITLEAMTQLSALGYDKTKQEKAIAWAKNNTELINSVGLKANYVFTAHALGFSEDATVRTAASEVVADVGDSGTLSTDNNFVYAWVIFALLAEDQKEMANQVALKLSSLSETEGGYKYAQGDSQTAIAPDVTAIALLAMNATLGSGDAATEAAKEFAISKAKNWLTSNVTELSFWSSNGGPDVSGTSYAIMALNALDVDVAMQTEWLKTRINPTDGGITAPWTEPKSDVFSSAQALLALSKLSFIDVLKNKIN
jgi:hypothetical protein